MFFKTYVHKHVMLNKLRSNNSKAAIQSNAKEDESFLNYFQKQESIKNLGSNLENIEKIEKIDSNLNHIESNNIIKKN